MPKPSKLLERIDTVVIDKTGTLTEGRPRLTAIMPVPGVDEIEVLRMAASVEQVSEHPVAGAIVAAARDRRVQLLEPRAFRVAHRTRASPVKSTGVSWWRVRARS